MFRKIFVFLASITSVLVFATPLALAHMNGGDDAGGGHGANHMSGSAGGESRMDGGGSHTSGGGHASGGTHMDGGGSHTGGGAGCATFVSDAGNNVTRCAASADPYRPNLEAATQRDLRLAKELHQATMDWCAAHPNTASLSRDGYRPVRPGATHWGLPFEALRGEFVAGKPKMAVVRDGEVIGVVYTAKDGFPYLGSIPRPHQHHPGVPEMLHVWCSEDLATAFTTRPPHLVHTMGGGTEGSPASSPTDGHGGAGGSGHMGQHSEHSDARGSRCG